MTSRHFTLALALLALAAGHAAAQETFKPNTAPSRPPAGSPAGKEMPRTRPKQSTPKPEAESTTSPKSAPKSAADRRREEGKKVFERERVEAPAGAWSVLIASFRGDGARQAAEEGLRRVHTIAGLPDATLEERGSALVIAYGRFAAPSDPAAQAALKKIRELEVTLPDGRTGTPFAEAVLVPAEGGAGSIPEYDLRNAKKLKGDWALYTLQIAVYGRVDQQAPSAADIAEARKAAEDAVIALRREGEQAFYYHGQRSSIVTIGLFGKDDFTPGEGTGRAEYESPALKLLMKRYPYNMVNGAQLNQSVRVQSNDGGLKKVQMPQPSSLVAVPKE